MAAFLAVILFLILTYSVYKYWTQKSKYWKHKNVQYIQPLPILGNFREYILLRKYVGEVTQELCRCFPNEPYVGAFYGTEPVLIVKDPELIKLVMTKDFYYFSSREVSMYTDKEVMTQNLFFTYGDRWKVLRQNLTPIFSSAKMRNMFHLIEQCSHVFEELLDHETDKTDVIDTRSLMSRFTMDCIGACGFGIDTKTMDKNSSNNIFYIIGHKILDNSTATALKWIARCMWPATFYRLGFKTFAPEIDVFFKNLLTSVFKNREYKPTARNDFVDSILTFKNKKIITGDRISNVKNGKNETVGLEVDDELLVGLSLGFFAAGYETSATTSAFTLYELAKDKGAQKRVQAEIDGYLKRNGNTLNYDLVTELTYTESCVDETLRLYPVLGVITREVVEDYTLPTGLLLKKGCRVHIPVYHMHRDPAYFPNPEQFRPERFARQNRDSVQAYTYMPFGEGPRICIGMRFAKMQVLAGLMTVLKKFNVELASGMSVMELEPRAIVTQAKSGIKLKFSPRLDCEQRVYAQRHV